MNGIQENEKCESAQNASQLIGIEKKCSKCGKMKIQSEFYGDKRTSDKLYSSCKECFIKVCRAWSIVHPGKITMINKKWRVNNPDKRRNGYREWASKNPTKVKESHVRWKTMNPERVKEHSRLWRTVNIVKVRDQNRTINHRISCAVSISLKGSKAGRHWETLVGYTLEQLKGHLEKRFKVGMSWENRSQWHIDHIIPRSAFNFEKSEDIDFKRCWNLKNLQPLWAKENMSKGAKVERPFQPNLNINISGG